MQARSIDRPLCSSHSSMISHVVPMDSRRREPAEAFIRTVFADQYGARVPAFAPELMVLEQNAEIVAAAGWRGAGGGPLYLEHYLDEPVEAYIARLAGHPVMRDRVVEVGNLAAVKAGWGSRMILALAAHLDRLGYEWVVFTATDELIGIFAKLGLPPLALMQANPHRLGDAAQAWGSYYDMKPVVVAGCIRPALERIARQRSERHA